MLSSNIAPKWWQLYLTVPLLVVLFLLENRLKLSQRGHIVAQIGILLLVYGLIHWWLKANAAALSKMDRRQSHGRITVIQIPPTQLPDAGTDNQPMFGFPDSEIKAVLSDTFEMDCIDAEFIEQEHSDGRVGSVRLPYRDHQVTKE
jgi:hypothetical protein